MSSLPEAESKWSKLPSDILSVISNKLNCNTDPSLGIHNLRLRSVCKSWRYSIPISPTPPPTLLLPFPIAPNPSLNPNHRGHFTLSRSTTYLIQHYSSSSSPYWLLRVENKDKNKFRPLNPLSRLLTNNTRLPKGFPKSINLLDFRVSQLDTSCMLEFVDLSNNPDIGVCFQEIHSFHAKKVALCSTAVMAISGAKLCFFEFGKDKKWREVDNSSKYQDIVFHNGKFYALGMTGRVVEIGVSDLKVVEIVPRLGFSGHGGYSKTLVECNGALYLIDKNLEPDEQLWYDEDVGAYVGVSELDEAVHLKIYKLNKVERDWEMVYDLGNYVFFVGDDSSYSVLGLDFPALKTSCVYFLDDSYIDANESEEKLGEFCSDIGVYSLDDGSCGPLANFPDHWPLFLPSPACIEPKAFNSKKKIR